MSGFTVIKKSVNKVEYQGKVYTCNGERIVIDGQVRWLYRTKNGLDCDILICDDRYAEEPEFTHLSKLPSGCYTIPESDRKSTPKYLTFTAVGSDKTTSVGFYYDGKGATDLGRVLEFSDDGGNKWKNYTIGIGLNNAIYVELENGESVMFRGKNESLSTSTGSTNLKCSIKGKISASGEITSLLNGVGGDVSVPQYCFFDMFRGCTGLTSAPSLPSTTLAVECYHGMFNGCISLTSAPVLPATTLANYCYSSMFYGCTGITSHEVETLNDSPNTFYDNLSCVSLTIHADTPPTIGESTITGLNKDCVIYVPDEASVNDYRKAQYWSERDEYIQATPSPVTPGKV